MSGVEEEMVMANVQGVSFDKKGEDDCHRAKRCVLTVCSKADGWADPARPFCLRKRSRDELNKSVCQLKVVAVALEIEQFRLSPARKKGDDEVALSHYLGAAQGKVPMHEDLRDWIGVPDLWDLAGGGLFSKDPLHILVMRGWDPVATPLMKGIVTEIMDRWRLTVLEA
jgi:hypothetical protein